METQPAPTRAQTLEIPVHAQAEALRLERIRMAAYELLRARSGKGDRGDALTDWVRAEQRVSESHWPQRQE